MKNHLKNPIAIVLVVICLALGGNIYRIKKEHKEQLQSHIEKYDSTRIADLEAKIISSNARENDLLRQNGELVKELNELKFINSKPTIIYKSYEKKRNVNDDASDEFNDILSRRYLQSDSE